MCQPRLQVPPGVEVPDLTHLEDEMMQVFRLYLNNQALWNSLPVTREDFRLVWAYCDKYKDPVLDYISQNGMQGYNLYVHEVFELEWYFERGLDPYTRPREDAEREKWEYDQAHSLALIVEHRYPQRLARSEGHNFSLRELILCNPVSGQPEWDWNCVRENREHELHPDDHSRRDDLTPVRDWYRSKGFKPPDDL